MRYCFDDFEVDTQRYELRKAGVVQPLEPQGFNVLAYLLEQRERVVAKDELLERLWPGQHVTDATLTQRVVAIRRALGDTGRTQRYIRTVHRRGYRFVAAVGTAPAAPSGQATTPAPAPARPLVVGQRHTMFVGREAELALLQERLGRALRGERQVVFVSGEAGIGKTTLVDAFLAQAQATTTVWMGRGQCIEHYGAGEAYLPILEALSRLGREPHSASLRTALRQQAPSWLGHLPALHTAEDAALLPQSANLTPERMLRELTNALDQVTATQPLLLVLEDLHWSDVSTVDWLSYVARRRDPAQLCIVGTYRPGDALAHAHPLPLAVQELSRQHQALEIPLPYWTVAELTAYLVQRFGTLPFAGELIRLLHQRTNGNPFFLVALVDSMATPERLEALTGAGGTLTAALPGSIRHLIDYQLEALSVEDQGLLEAASVVGEAFATAAVAAARGETIEAVERHCDTLARKGQFVYTLGLESWPDGTISTRYGFRHALYQEVLYARLAPGLLLRLHQHIGLHKERAYGTQAPEIATELALHFVRGQEPQRAVQYLSTAAQQALHRCAYQEALQHLEQALHWLPQLPEESVRTQYALTLHLDRGRAYMLLRGYGAPEVEQAYQQAYTLGQQLGDTPSLFPVLYGLWLFYEVRAEHLRALELVERCHRIAQATADAALLAATHSAMGTTLFCLGRLEEARQVFAQELAKADSAHDRRNADVRAVYDAWSMILLQGTNTCWLLGYAEQARRYCAQAQELAQHHGDPVSQAFALLASLYLAYYERHSAQVQQQAEAVLTLATEHGFPFWIALGSIFRGWALVMQQHEAEGLALLQRGVQAYQDTGTVGFVPYYLGMLAEAYGTLRHVEPGLEAVREALAIVERTGETFFAAEVHRLHGELVLMQPPTPDREPQAEQCFVQALEVARQQHAHTLELRAALSLGQLWQRQGKGDAARQVVREIYRWFPADLDTPDLQQARTFLQET